MQKFHAAEPTDQDSVLPNTGAPVPGETDQRLQDKKVARKLAKAVSRSRKDVRENEKVILAALPILDRLLDMK